MSVRKQIELIGIWTKHFHAHKNAMSKSERKDYAKRLKALCDEAKSEAVKQGYKI